MSQEKNKRNRSKLSTTSLDDLNTTKKPNHRDNTILESSEEEKQEHGDEYEKYLQAKETKVSPMKQTSRNIIRTILSIVPKIITIIDKNIFFSAKYFF